ncbi:MAG: rRNA pseudouridine synthase [Tenericutes bacterium HGW-Tenericutes-4]|jgi:pseudouridine synthase|nr:MAG: rRNA pseudouridine synthase [Tenericutes bacterium HGW-Tenericutes-4]
MRINKYLATCGIASRRKVEQLIVDGKVSVNGKVITNLATDIDEKKDVVTLNNETVKLVEEKVYYLLNKPKGYISAVSDKNGRKTIVELIDTTERIFPIGRLDYDTEGLIILTNDGELAHKLMHPSHEVEKTYVANIQGDMLESELAVLRSGVVIDGERTAKARVKKLKFEEGVCRVELVIHEGRNRQVRKMFEAIGKEVLFLKRIAIGDLKVGGLNRKEYRLLKPFEIEYLKNL